MMGAVKTKDQELPENRVRLEVEVPSDHMKHAVEHASSDLAATTKIPGFRKGKVPQKVLEARVGREREAKFQWDQSLTLDPEPEEVEKIKKKLSDGISEAMYNTAFSASLMV